MDEILIEEVVSTLVDAGTFENQEIEDVIAKLRVPNIPFEELRTKFTHAFLAHPDILKQFSYKEIVKKAYDFTEIYLDYVPSN